MKIQKQLQDILGGALGLVGMIESLLHDDKEGAATAGMPAKKKGTGGKKPAAAKGKTGEAKAGHTAVVKKKGAGKPAAARKATVPVKKAAVSAAVKGGKKAVAGSAAKG